MVVYLKLSNRRLFTQTTNLLRETWTKHLLFRNFSMGTALNQDKVAAMRIDYKVSNIDDTSLPSKDPFKWFDIWFQDAVENPVVVEANAMNIATASKDGKVTARMVLLKGITEKGFRFFTNHGSTKGQQLNENPYAALTFYWEPLQRQVRINGPVERISDEESTKYFHSRPVASQIGAWVSHQTTIIPNEEFLEEKRKMLVDKYEGKIVPKPDYWGGYVVIPELIEFWCGGSGRLHDRIQFRRPNDGEVIDEKLTKKGDNGWLYERLSP